MSKSFDFSRYIEKGLVKAYKTEHIRRIKAGIAKKKAKK